MPAPDATLLVSGHCPNCPAVLTAMADLVKQGRVGRLTVINVEARPEAAQELGVRSVPWLRLGVFEFVGLHSQAELAAWAQKADTEAGWADYFHMLLREGQAARAAELVEAEASRLAAVLPIVANPEASLNVRIGAGVLLEAFAGQAPLRALAGRLGELSTHPDARVRADACHYLGLSGAPEARAWLEARLGDEDLEVREIARESLDALAAE